MGKQAEMDDIYKMLSKSGYSDKAIQYFQAKDSIGILEDADQITDVTGPCGDNIKIYLNIDGKKISDAKVQVLGCPGAVVSSCAVVNLAKGKTLKEAGRIDMDALYEELEKLPDQKVHCARLAVKTLQKALDDYGQKNQNRAVNESK